MNMDYMHFLAWVDRCLFPVNLANDLKELGLDEKTALYYEIEWSSWNKNNPHKFAIVYLYQCYCVGGRPPEEGDVGYYLKLWLEKQYKVYEGYKINRK